MYYEDITVRELRLEKKFSPVEVVGVIEHLYDNWSDISDYLVDMVHSYNFSYDKTTSTPSKGIYAYAVNDSFYDKQVYRICFYTKGEALIVSIQECHEKRTNTSIDRKYDEAIVHSIGADDVEWLFGLDDEEEGIW